jgi:hypothetical protein
MRNTFSIVKVRPFHIKMCLLKLNVSTPNFINFFCLKHMYTRIWIVVTQISHLMKFKNKREKMRIFFLEVFLIFHLFLKHQVTVSKWEIFPK